MTLLVAAQLADLAAYLLVGRPDDSIVQALGVDVPAAKLAGIAAAVLLVAALRRLSSAWARRGILIAALAGLVGAATGIRVLVAS